MLLNRLSGRFLILTVIVVMLAEVMIFLPSIARFRLNHLNSRLESAQIASLAFEADPELSRELVRELLDTAGIYNVVLRRDEMRRLVLDGTVPSPVSETFDLRDPTYATLLVDALRAMIDTDQQTIRVFGNPTQKAGDLIEVTMPAGPLRTEMLQFTLRVLLLSAAISVVTAGALFLSVRRYLVVPIKGVVNAMKSYAEAPEDARRIIVPSAGLIELREAEAALQEMQRQLTVALRQKDRLAQLGGAVAKISHDLRNILTTAQLFADRLEMSEDPQVARMTPKLLNSISRAVNLCESTLAFGRAEEPSPVLTRVELEPLIAEVLEAEAMTAGPEVRFAQTIPAGLRVRADPEQLHRVLSNLVRNARQAIGLARSGGQVTVTALDEPENWTILVADDGPGMPAKARENLFRAFQGGSRKGGTGLGLAISAELVRGHGGRLELRETDGAGTVFAIVLPKGIGVLEAAAE